MPRPPLRRRRGALAAALSLTASGLAASQLSARASGSTSFVTPPGLHGLRGSRSLSLAAAPEKTPAAAGKDVEPVEGWLGEEVSGDDPLVLELEERMRKMMGNKDLTLDMVLNPGTIVNTEREVILLRAELKTVPEEDGERRQKLEDKIEEKQMKVVNEMRQVMTDNLKIEFLIQAAISVPLFGSMCYGTFPYINLSWLGLTPQGVKFVFQLFGLWGIWLVTVPALRARKPGGPYGMGYEERRALDLSFLVLPLICVLTPFLSKNPVLTFWACLLTLGALYLWSFNTPLAEENKDASRRGASTVTSSDLPEPVQWALKALDFGTGSERGMRSEDTSWQEQLAAYERAAEELAAAKAANEASEDSKQKEAA